MERNDKTYNQFIQIMNEELRPAMGCTEPIAIAYAAAKAREVLETKPERLLIEVSGNIIKNVKSVVVPHTGACAGSPPQPQREPPRGTRKKSSKLSRT